MGMKFQSSLTRKEMHFKTRNGRIVFDGGGIEPDVIISKSSMSEATKALLKSDAIFNFATDYYYKNKSIEKPENFVFDDSNYNEFTSYLKDSKSTFKTRSEMKFESAFMTAKDEKLTNDNNAAYNKLLLELQDQKIKALDQNKEEIKENLSDEILTRYFFKKGEYQNHIVYNRSILEAVKILNDENKYHAILSNTDD